MNEVIGLCITDKEVTYLLRALKERQKTAKTRAERLSLANIRDLIEYQTGRRKGDQLHFRAEWEKQQKEGKR